MKPWQKGFDLDYLKELELRFSSYNDYAQHELSKFKKNNIADALSKDNIILLRDDAVIHYNSIKVKSSKINESFASKPVASTAPKKEVIAESTNVMAERFKKLANIN